MKINVFEPKSKENTVKPIVFQHFETKSYNTQGKSMNQWIESMSRIYESNQQIGSMIRIYRSNQRIRSTNRNNESTLWIESVNRFNESNQWIGSMNRIDESNQCIESMSRINNFKRSCKISFNIILKEVLTEVSN